MESESEEYCHREIVELNTIIESKVFNNDVILRRLFGYLPLESIKQCRLVCARWKSLAEYRFRNISTIVFSDTILSSSRKTRNFDRLFQSNDSVLLPFTSYKFVGKCKYIAEFLNVEFYNQGRESMKELTLDNVTHYGNSQISNIIELGFCTSNITLLRIMQSDYGTKWSVPVDELVSLKTLDLVNCTVVLTPEKKKISPLEIGLRDISFTRAGQKLSNIFINEFVNFSKMETLILDCRIGKNISIDLCDIIKIDILNLAYVRVIWGNITKCTVNKLTLRGIPYEQKIRNLHTNELNIDCTLVELSSLPDTLTKLKLTRNFVKRDNHFMSKNLKSLKYSYNEGDLPKLKTFFNLAELSLKSQYTPLPLSLESLPKKVKRMKLSNIIIIGAGIYKLDTLIIKNGYWMDARHLLDSIKPNNLVIYRKQSNNLLKLKDLEKIRFFIERPFQSVVVGKIEWSSDSEFAQSNISKLVDRKAEYYRFVEQKGKAISEDEYQKIVKM